MSSYDSDRMPTSQSVVSAERWTRLAVALALTFAALNTVNAINKGGDAEVFIEGGRRLLHADPLYDGSSAAAGFIGPPFQAVFFVPFAALAALSPVVAKLLWHITGIACLIAGMVFITRSWSMARLDLGLPAAAAFPAAFAPLLAVLLPLQTNFEHQNMNPLLLALMVGATWLVARGSDAVAGVVLGVAIALKAFPALLVIVLVCRARWRAVAAAVGVAIVLTLLPLPLYGFDGYVQLLRDFSRLAGSGFPARGNNQSLFAAFDRLMGPADDDFIHQAEGPVRIAYGVVAVLMLLALTIVSLRTRRPSIATIIIQLYAAIAVAVLLSPIAWDHYWVLMLPALVVLHDSRNPRLLGAAGPVVFWSAAVLITGLSRALLGRELFGLARAFSSYTIAGLIIVGALVWISARVSKNVAAGTVLSE
jgi:Glycosyltransferase family 87